MTSSKASGPVSAPAEPLEPECAEADFDGDGAVGPNDFFSVLRPSMGSAPGPGVTE